LLFVTTTDFSTGSYSTIDLDDLSAAVNLPTPGIIESDNDAVYFNDKVYVINRFSFDNISVLEMSDLTTAVAQFSTGNGTNPQDMAFVSDTQVYVSLYGSNDVLVVDPTASPGNEITGTIDLSVFLDAGDTDGDSEASAMEIVGDYLFVALQRLDNFTVVRDAYLAVIDTTTDTLVDVDPSTPGVIDPIVLTGRNPQFMHYDADLDKLVVSETGSYFANDGGVEVVDPVTFQAEGFVIDESTLGSDIGDAVIVNGSIGFVVVGGFNPNEVSAFDVTVDPGTGAVSGSNPRPLFLSSPFVPSLAVDGADRLFVPDRTAVDPGIRVYDTATETEITASPIDVGLPPQTVIVLE
jgi:hypothetical protein